MTTREYEILTYYCSQQSSKRRPPLSILVDPEYEGTVLHRNGRNYFQIDMTQHIRKGDSSRNYAINIITNTSEGWMVINMFRSTLNILQTVVMNLLWY